MTAVLTRQYRPLADTDTAGDDALSALDIRELAAGLNNMKAHLAGKLYGRLSGSIGAANHYMWIGDTPAATEYVVDFVTRPLATGINRLIFQIGGQMTASATGTCTWKLYCSKQRYSGPEAFDVTFLGALYAVSTGIVIETDSHECPPAVDDLVAMRDAAGDCHLTLTATNTVTESEYCTLSSIAVSPKVIL